MCFVSRVIEHYSPASSDHTCIAPNKDSSWSVADTVSMASGVGGVDSCAVRCRSRGYAFFGESLPKASQPMCPRYMCTHQSNGHQTLSMLYTAAHVCYVLYLCVVRPWMSNGHQSAMPVLRSEQWEAFGARVLQRRDVGSLAPGPSSGIEESVYPILQNQ